MQAGCRCMIHYLRLSKESSKLSNHNLSHFIIFIVAWRGYEGDHLSHVSLNNRTTMKRRASPFSEVEAVCPVKREIKHAERSRPSTLERPISPPVLTKKSGFKPSPTLATVDDRGPLIENNRFRPNPKLADVEAGEATVDDHFLFFPSKLLEYSKPNAHGTPRISHQAWFELYQRNLNPHGRHFVIHQHDHPVAGTHYDLRLQCNGTSSISFAIMYGLPGDPNSRRLNRNATETRVHNLWVGTGSIQVYASLHVHWYFLSASKQT